MQSEVKGLINYITISNINKITKLLEWLLLAEIQDHIIIASSFNHFKSKYQKYHSMEMALLRTLANSLHSTELVTLVISINLEI